MQSLTLSTIPRWLEQSRLAQSLREGSATQANDVNEAFEVPEEYYMSDNDVQTIATSVQLEHMLQTIHYWGEYERVPECVLDSVREKRLNPKVLDDTKWVNDPIMATVVKTLQIIHEHGMTATCSYALACIGSIEGLRYAHEHGCPWDKKTCAWAAQNGHYDCLRYAHEHGCPWDENTCAFAAFNGHYDCLRYAHENGCPWDNCTCTYAAKYGHYDCLRYAHEHGCPWNENTCAFAASNGHYDCLRYAHENGCSWNKYTCVNALLE